MPDKPNYLLKPSAPLSLKSLKQLFKNLNEIPVAARHGRCVPLIDSQQMVRSWITTIENDKASKSKKKTKKQTAEKKP